MKLNINVIAHSVQEDSSNPNELPGTKDEATRDAVNLLLASRRLLIVARALLCWLAFELQLKPSADEAVRNLPTVRA